MSKFVDKLNKTAQSGAPPMGFRTSQGAPPKQGIHLVALVTGEAGEVVDEIRAADAALVRGSSVTVAARSMKKASKSVADVLWGIWPEKVSGDDSAQLATAGSDFAVLAAGGTAVLIGPDEDVGVIVQVDTSLHENLLRAVSDMPVDAALVTPGAAWEHPLTWSQLMLLHRFASLAAKPLLLQIPAGLAPDELKLIWEAGVEAVVVKAEAGETARLRQVIDEMEAPTPRRRPRMDAALPHTGAGGDGGVDIEEPDDDDDD
jgi:hypothetical protein